MKTLFFLCLMAAVLYACTPGGPESLDDFDTVITSYEPSFNFSGVKTYVLIDSVVEIKDSNDPGSNVQLSKSLNSYILQQVASHLDKLGYTRLTTPELNRKPDVVVQVSALATKNVAVYSDYNYWWNNWGWYAGWGYYYPSFSNGWYPYGSVAYARYTTGTVSIDMTNPNGANSSTKQIPQVWSGAILGVTAGSNANLQQRIGDGIDKAFQQSPYL